MRSGHSLDSHILCGGGSNTCLRWNLETGLWEHLLTLDNERSGHVSWTPDLEFGIFLIGGSEEASKRTTTLIRPDLTQEVGFSLLYDTEYVEGTGGCLLLIFHHLMCAVVPVA